jgi:O-antigen ligase
VRPSRSSNFIPRLGRLVAGRPLGAFAALWPLVLLTPYAPWIPLPANGGLSWRQETALAVLLSVGFALLFLRARRADFRAAPSEKPGRLLTFSLAAFVSWGAASMLWAPDFFSARHYAVSWLAYLLFFVLVRRSAAAPRLMRASLTTLSVVVFAISLASIIGHYGTIDSHMRRTGLGEPTAVAVPIFAALALRLRSRRAALLCGVTATAAWLSTLEVAERAPFVGLAAGLALLCAAMFVFAQHRPRGLRRVALLGVAFCACALVQFAPAPIVESRHQAVFVRLKETSAEESNTKARMLYWGAALEMWRARPLAGVGADGFDATFPEARAKLAADYPDSPLVGINESFLSTGAHNEYLQMLAELGAVGLALFVAFAAALVFAAWRALRVARSPLVPGAVASLAVFAVSSGASPISFHWMGSGLLFFCAAALVSHFAARQSDSAAAAAREQSRGLRARPNFARWSFACGLALSLVVTAAMCLHAAGVVQRARAQAAGDAADTERLYRSALFFSPSDPATHYDYGVWLFGQKRERESVAHLRFAVERGFNASPCFAYLAGAEASAGDPAASERTLAFASRVYPQSVFLRVRHAAALARTGHVAEGESEMSAALLIDARAARGWQQLIERDIDPAIEAARRDPEIAMPGELAPQEAVFAVLEENERRFPAAVSTGWRARRTHSSDTQ